jgi:GTP-binding protein
MIPVIAILGRPNVGKSTLFNYLTRSRAALVADQPGVTRDRQYGNGTFQERRFIVVDTGGIEQDTDLQHQVSQQAWLATEEAQIIFWVVDARSGLTVIDAQIAKRLRTLNKPIYLLVNKTDGLDPAIACAEFHSYGIPKLFPVAAAQGAGLVSVLEEALSLFPTTPEDLTADVAQTGIKVAVVGRPNVGKSTLVNRILGEERVLVYDAPGTTRDSIFIPFERQNKKYTLIDTAGVRRRRSVDEPVEKFSVVKTLQAISEANVVVFVVDARESLADQDLHLLGFILDSGRALVIAVNKWDGLSEDQRTTMEKALDRRLTFVRFARVHFISALHGSGVGNLFTSINEAYRSATRKLSTPKLTDILERAVESHQPPAVSGRRIKLRYAHAGGSNPPVVVIHGNQTNALPGAYKRYLMNYFRDTLSLKGTPLIIELRSGANPFEGKKNVLTERQVKRRQRLMKHVKKNKK